jgi:hypothetical protein
MVALRTTPLRRRIAIGGYSSTAVYLLLLSGGYLSWRALRDWRRVIAEIQYVIWYWSQRDIPIGLELSGLIEHRLMNQDYLSWWARTWGARSISRRFGL